MKILVFSEWFSEKMGYSENCLPKALAGLGNEVHLITSNTQIYFNSPTYSEIYQKFLGPGIVECGTKHIDGYTLTRLPYCQLKSRIVVKGLFKTIRQIQPDIVQTFDTNTLVTFLLALYRPFSHYKLFLESHIHASVLNKGQRCSTFRSKMMKALFKLIGRIISSQSSLCYPISVDSAKVAVDYYGIERNKIKIIPLGVDNEIFFPAGNDEISISNREKVRERVGLSIDDIVVIYTGRLSEDKNPYCLAKAIEFLNTSHPGFRGLFIGDGPQSELIIKTVGCTVIPFMPSTELADYYRSADIGVWPKQESTSQIDAVCCGLPIIISDRTSVPERVQGNGFTYRENDPSDLAEKLLLLREKNQREEMGIRGAQRIKSQFGWNRIAAERIVDYKHALHQEQNIFIKNF